MMMQRNQQLSANRVNMGGGSSGYTLPVSVPVGTYGDANMLQASPQMAHQISPRPSSSETDSGTYSTILNFERFDIKCISTVYPSGSMLEMSNGYPHSSSPLGSPSPSPGIGGHHNKCKLTNIFLSFVVLLTNVNISKNLAHYIKILLLFNRQLITLFITNSTHQVGKILVGMQT